MLKITKKRNTEVKLDELSLDSFIVNSGDDENIITTADKNYLKSNDVINFKRETFKVSYNEDVNIKEILTKKSFSTNSFADKEVVIGTANSDVDVTNYLVDNAGVIRDLSKVTIHTKINGDEVKALRFIFDDFHYYLSEEEEEITIRANVSYKGEITSTNFRKMEKLCPDDYVVFDGIFLYKVKDFKNGVPVFDGNCYNYTEGYLKLYGNDTSLVLTCFTPYNMSIGEQSNSENNYSLYWIYEDDEDAEEVFTMIKDYYASCFVEDIRFVKDGELRTDTIVSKYLDYNRVNFPLSQHFGMDLINEDLSNQSFFEDKINNSVNEVVDYERRSFSPCFIDENHEYTETDDSIYKDISEIKFNLHFREREYERIISGDTIDYRDYGKWNTSDELYWNNYTISGDSEEEIQHLIQVNPNIDESDADLLGDLGFVDDDVYYQKNKIKKSFIRLSFYDTKNRGTQNLVFYSTIFLNSNDLYSKYMKIVNSGAETDEDFVYYEPENKDLRLCTSFSCYDKYDTSNCSEGFYLHLFPGVVKGTVPSTLYMKVEFNHAKYGKTIPFIMPVDSDNEPIKPTDSGFPINYTEKVDGGYKINMNKMLSDMYIEINVKYDALKKRYIWFLPRKYGEYNGKDRKIIFNLFEPRVNGTEIWK